MKKVLFIDRDGTLIKEPAHEQIDSFDKLEFVPGIFSNLSKISRSHDFEFVMITNQDGLGTDSFPEDKFWPVHNFILKSLENEGIIFNEVLIDRSFPEDNSPNRKPRTGLLKKYFSEEYDLKNSYVIGDRLSDVELAENLGCKAIFIKGFVSENKIRNNELSHCCSLITNNWNDIYKFLKLPERKAKIIRKTRETDITISLNLDGSGVSKIDTGLNFLNHMFEQVAKHSLIDIEVSAKGDLETDEHHLTEDSAIVLGQAVKKALSDKKGINRYGFLLPMDDALAQVVIDFSGRPWLVWNADFKREKIGDMPTEMFMHFFKSFSDNASCNLNIKCEGDNEHHKIEAIFKAFAKAIKYAVKRTDLNMIPSTKGMI